MLQNLQNIAKIQNFQLDNLVDFEKCWKTRIYLQKSVPIQPNTSNICRNFANRSRGARRAAHVARLLRPLLLPHLGVAVLQQVDDEALVAADEDSRDAYRAGYPPDFH